MGLTDNFTKVTNKMLATGQPAQLVAVTKTVGIDVIEQLYALGQRHFGENRADVLTAKQAALSDKYPDIVWHFIGSLQTRKVKEVLPATTYIHSLDRLSLAKEINKRATEESNCFVEVNVAGEANKHGMAPDDVIPFIEQLTHYPNIKVVGLMTMAPFVASEQELHEVFAQLKQLTNDVQALQLKHAPCLEASMGMSNDYQIALQEGATFVRVGTELVTVN
ncbi:YggS family pyridoxal phosphate-dependent enzyme [Brochothrix campestris]|uniref:Pyridoxal phosphate homeostasis protein n=1 Tax=Brochothrix campestris FSL F6-1037 TaxID=1265861 RepID=W7D171_9LIST|nr:YggS family pyridoxal phosphate-dependent enzyme [Brochothrix campestris]EUJ41731.1 hypothetical protein BCAMP_02570 [Brochothrix campestris FSL F6-1037]